MSFVQFLKSGDSDAVLASIPPVIYDPELLTIASTRFYYDPSVENLQILNTIYSRMRLFPFQVPIGLLSEGAFEKFFPDLLARYPFLSLVIATILANNQRGFQQIENMISLLEFNSLLSAPQMKLPSLFYSGSALGVKILGDRGLINTQEVIYGINLDVVNMLNNPAVLTALGYVDIPVEQILEWRQIHLNFDFTVLPSLSRNTQSNLFQHFLMEYQTGNPDAPISLINIMNSGYILTPENLQLIYQIDDFDLYQFLGVSRPIFLPGSLG